MDEYGKVRSFGGVMRGAQRIIKYLARDVIAIRAPALATDILEEYLCS
jgi:hypothetical protein